MEKELRVECALCNINQDLRICRSRQVRKIMNKVTIPFDVLDLLSHSTVVLAGRQQITYSNPAFKNLYKMFYYTMENSKSKDLQGFILNLAKSKEKAFAKMIITPSG